MLSRPERILGLAEDLVSNFLYYDRKNDEDLPVGQIEQAVEAGEISLEEIVEKFRITLERHLPTTPEP